MSYCLTPTALSDVLLLQPAVHADARGFFFESFHARHFAELTGLQVDFVQDNHSKSKKGVLRGLHYQIRHPQGKLVRVLQGSIFDVAVDLRRSSPTYGRWVGEVLSADDRKQLWIPPGFAHGFQVLGDSAEVLYKTTDYRHAEHERSLRWDDADLAIDWPLSGGPRLAAKDAHGLPFALADTYA